MLSSHEILFIVLLSLVNHSYAASAAEASDSVCPANSDGKCKADSARGNAMIQQKKLTQHVAGHLEDTDNPYLLVEITKQPVQPHVIHAFSTPHIKALATDDKGGTEGASSAPATAESPALIAVASTANATAGDHKSGSITIAESLAEKLKDTILDIEAMAKKDGIAIPPGFQSVLKKVTSGGMITAEDIRAIEDFAATTPGFAESNTAEMADKDHALLTANDFAMLNGGVRGEELSAGGKLPTFQGDMVSVATDEEEEETEEEDTEEEDTEDASMLALDEKEGEATESGRRRRRRRRRRSYTGSLSAGTRWTGGKVSYCFASDVDPAVKHIFMASVAQVSKALPKCFQFEDVGHQSGSSTTSSSGQRCKKSPAIFVQSANTGCWSYVGMTNLPSQGFNLAPRGCVSIGIAVHELGHALGMAHEHSRPDRDQYVTVETSNVPQAQMHNFDTVAKTFTGSPYDFLSVMHYDAYAFAVDQNKPTITVKGDFGYKIGQRNGLSKYDVIQMQAMYKPENGMCEKAGGMTGQGCINRPDSNGKDVCSGLSQCSAAVMELCCGCGGGFKVQCYAGAECPSSPTLPEPPANACFTDITAQYSGYACVFNNACDKTVQATCPSGCSYSIAPGGPRVQTCDGKVDASICSGGCTVS